MKIISDEVAAEAAIFLSQADTTLAPIIARVGICTFRPHRDYYRELVESIIGQQLSVKAAAAIRARFLAYFDATFPTPEQLVIVAADDLRALGFSYAKAGYVHDIAERMIDGKLRFDTIESLSNHEVIEELTAVKGVGVWTAHMFLMFAMGRTDVLPIGDLGIRNGIRALYNLPTVPTPDDVRIRGLKNNWHPYESIASWYIWQSLDNAPKL